jgi:hypothetical protein
LRGVVAIAASPVGVGELWTAAVEFFDRDADDARRVAHDQNLAANPPPATLDTSEEFIERYVANGAQYWFNPRFDSSYLWDGVEVNLPLYLRLFDLYGDDYRVESLDVPTFPRARPVRLHRAVSPLGRAQGTIRQPPLSALRPQRAHSTTRTTPRVHRRHRRVDPIALNSIPSRRVGVAGVGQPAAMRATTTEAAWRSNFRRRWS